MAATPDPLLAEAREAAAGGMRGLVAAHRQSGADDALFVVLSALAERPEAEVTRLLGTLTYELSDAEYAGPALEATQTLHNGIAALSDVYGPGTMRQAALVNLLLDAIGIESITKAAEEALDKGAER